MSEFMHKTISLFTKKSNNKAVFLVSTFLLCAVILSAQAKNIETANTSKDKSALLNEYKSLGKRLADNQFKRPLVLNSTESADSLKGEIYAVVDYPFATVSTALNNPNNWCDALILHLNIKYCKADNTKPSTVIQLNLGKKYDQQLSDTYKTDFNYQEISQSPQYFSIELKAKQGALGTYDYHIFVEATPLENGQTFLHFTYSYSFGLSSRIAMKGYLATIGSGKVGFTMLDEANGKPKLIQGVRSVVERNTMRYYLAIDSFLATINEPPEQVLEKRLTTWFDATEQYPTQLREVTRDEYLSMKRKEYARQQAVNADASS